MEASSPLGKGTPQRIAPAIGLFLLSPLVAEFLLGNIAIDALFALLVLAPLYGGGTVLIREVTRRSGRGWPTMIVLGMAYAVCEEALATQSLFNPNYAGADLLRITFVPALGIGIWWTVYVMTLHTVWSTNVPIAIVESFVPERSTKPWLGNIGLGIAAVLFVLGAIFTFVSTYTQTGFLAPLPQLIGALVAIVVLIALAFALPTAPQPRLASPAPSPWLVGAVSFVLTSIFVQRLGALDGWVVVAIYLLLDVVAIVLILRWSRQVGWGQQHILALAGGALLTYAWHAFPQQPIAGSTGQIDLIGNAIFALGAIALLAVAASRVGGRRSEGGSRAIGSEVHQAPRVADAAPPTSDLRPVRQCRHDSRCRCRRYSRRSRFCRRPRSALRRAEG
jgi:hypothetical protein